MCLCTRLSLPLPDRGGPLDKTIVTRFMPSTEQRGIRRHQVKEIHTNWDHAPSDQLPLLRLISRYEVAIPVRWLRNLPATIT